VCEQIAAWFFFGSQLEINCRHSQRIMDIRWPKISSSTKLWEACNITNQTETVVMDWSYSEEGG
jgi:hypothetical protein